MDGETKKRVVELYEEYRKSQTVMYGSPDQFQYRKNKLIDLLCEFILIPHADMLKEMKDSSPIPNGVGYDT